MGSGPGLAFHIVMTTVTMAFLTVGFLILTALARAEDYNGHGYAYFGGLGGDISATMTAGAGGERFLYKGLAAGADIGGAFGNSYFGLLSVNPAYHFTNRDRARGIVPFVTGGYSLAFPYGGLNLFNYGGGATWWFKEKLGIRFEIRDHRDKRFEEIQFVAFRIGIAFR